MVLSPKQIIPMSPRRAWLDGMARIKRVDRSCTLLADSSIFIIERATTDRSRRFGSILLLLSSLFFNIYTSVSNKDGRRWHTFGR
jgi:hypothetical protein